jgi:hypothetical protein
LAAWRLSLIAGETLRFAARWLLTIRASWRKT